MSRVLAFDFGASTGRAILGEEFTQTKKGRVRIEVKKSV